MPREPNGKQFNGREKDGQLEVQTSYGDPFYGRFLYEHAVPKDHFLVKLNLSQEHYAKRPEPRGVTTATTN